jgi:hypothetical protein
MLLNFESISKTHISAISTLCYFDIFSYPLKAEEIQAFSSQKIDDNELESLVKLGVLKRDKEYFYLGIASNNVDERIIGNKRAKKLENKAIRQSNKIGAFPFVRSVSLSGSMSKGYMAQDADLDFFIITEPKRLWLARTLLILYKKVFLLNSRKFFCVNYFVDTDHLKIEEENLFTATELITLRNVYGADIHQDFLKSNSWVKPLFPYFKPAHLIGEKRDSLLKRFVERALNGKLGDMLDEWCMRMTMNRWKNQFVGMDRSDFEIAFKSRKYVSKHHPRNYQKYVLKEIEKRKELITEKYGIAW